MSSKNLSKQSYYERNKDKILAEQQAKRNAKYEGLIEGYDYIVCKECGFRSSELATHIINKHNMLIEEYKNKHQVTTVKSAKAIERLKGPNNPAYQHNGKYSPFSDKFIKGTKNVEKTKRKAKENKKILNKDNTQLEYWLEKTNGNEVEAKKLLSERQSTFSLEKCIKKYGAEEGTKKWNERQEKWLKSFPKSNFSKISQELFWNICDNLPSLDNIYFAELNENKQKDDSGKNYEYTLLLSNRSIKPDFINVSTKKVIEFDGEYWHSVKNKNYTFIIEKDKNREIDLNNNGYKLLRIKENDYKNDKQGTIQKCINFLTQ
jgi:Protein of unknown function (DUF559)